MGTKRNPAEVRDEQWKTPPGSTKPAHTIDQDHAAGGRERRIITVAGAGGALGRIALQPRYRRIYAELRWQSAKEGRETGSVYLGEVCERTRAANLAEAWRRAHANGLTQSTPGDQVR
jgi:hypothetical protein